MSDRPILDKNADANKFESYYYLKEELIDFCKQEGLQTKGGKIELTNRIAYYLNTGEKLSGKKQGKKSIVVFEITKDTLIEEDITCSETHRAFFKEKIGRTFSFNVAFQKWLKTNAGKTYNEAIEAYYEIIERKKQSKTVIDKQFEYNTYIRDFFENNKGKSLDEAIKCWKYKKSLEGHNRYEESDLTTLN